jgi:lysophospholipase L1-like esterase
MRAWALTFVGAVVLASCSKPREVKRQSPPPETPVQADPAPLAVASAPPPPAPKQPERRRYRVLALGDSITDQRVGGGGYLRELGRACPLSQFEHFGRGGDMVSQMRRRFEQELPSRRGDYDTLIVYGGVNDLYSDLTAGRTNELIESDLSAIYRQAEAFGLRVVAITVSPWGGFTRYFNERRSRSTRLLNSWIQGTTASGLTDVVVDSYGILSCGDSERLCPEYETPAHDGLHPGPAGHALLARALLERAFSDCE